MTEYFTSENEIYARYAAQGLFLLCTLILIINQVKKYKFSKKDFFKNNTLPVASFFLLLIASVFKENAGITATTIFVSIAVLHFACNRKFYPLHKIFYFLFLYALLRIFGTIGTPQGFRFPDTILTFFVLPLSLCFINIKQKTLLKIAKIFTRVMIVHMAVCLLYWLYNYQYLDISLSEWLTEKSSSAILPDGFEKSDARFFVTVWSGYFHPTYISFGWFMGLITSAYLFYRRKIDGFELLLYSILCVIVILLTESRIGIVTFPALSIISLLLYSILKKKYVVPLLLSIIITVMSGTFLINESTEKDKNMMYDAPRSNYYPIAINYIKNNPYWGCGYHEQRVALDQQIALDSVTSGSVYVGKRLNYSHNQFLGDTVQYGILGLAILFVLLAAILFYAIKWRSYPLAMFLLVLIFYMMVEEPLYLQTGITRVTIFFVFFVALTNRHTNNKIYVGKH